MCELRVSVSEPNREGAVLSSDYFQREVVSEVAATVALAVDLLFKSREVLTLRTERRASRTICSRFVDEASKGAAMAALNEDLFRKRREIRRSTSGQVITPISSLLSPLSSPLLSPLSSLLSSAWLLGSHSSSTPRRSSNRVCIPGHSTGGSQTKQSITQVQVRSPQNLSRSPRSKAAVVTSDVLSGLPSRCLTRRAGVSGCSDSLFDFIVWLCTLLDSEVKYARLYKVRYAQIIPYFAHFMIRTHRVHPGTLQPVAYSFRTYSCRGAR